MKRLSGPRKAANLPKPIHQQLNMYALAASAAGVSMLVLAQPSNAKVIYTKTHQVIGQEGIYNLDLNHDGNVDFLIQQWGGEGSTSYRSNGLMAKEALGNAVHGTASQYRKFATALKAGAQIGPKQRFVAGGYNGEVMASVTHCCTTGSDHYIGPWVNVKNRYLGLRFKIDGKIHYGWARLSVHIQQLHITATLTGYAYETVPNRGIIAGQTTDKADDAAVDKISQNSGRSDSGASVANISDMRQAPSLGMLSLGSQSTLIRRQP
jgi:hypothetical protein